MQARRLGSSLDTRLPNVDPTSTVSRVIRAGGPAGIKNTMVR